MFLKTVLCLLFVGFSLASQGQFKPGYYYDNNNIKVTGLIKFRQRAELFPDKSDGVCDILFKENADAKRIKFTTRDINSFVVGSDSFIVLKNFPIDQYVHFRQDFVEVIITGKINLYRYYNFDPTAQRIVGIWLIEKNRHIEYLTKARFKHFFKKSIINDSPETLQLIEVKKLKYRDLPEIIQQYNKEEQKRKQGVDQRPKQVSVTFLSLFSFIIT